MKKFKIGVIGDSFRVPLRESVTMAKNLGADGISFYAATKNLSPEILMPNQRLEFKNYCTDAGLEIASLVGELGGHGWQREEENERKIPQLKRMVELAVGLLQSVYYDHRGDG